MRWHSGASSGGGTLDSQGVVTGAVQVPPDGDPVVLLPDHATLGGYPVLAVVASVDLGLLGQCAPGTRVRLVPVASSEADDARRTTAPGAGARRGRAPTHWRSTDDQSSSFTAVPTATTMTTTRSAGAGRARASRAPA